MYADLYGVVGTYQPVDVNVPDTTQRFPLGQTLQGVDPYWGFGEFVYVKNQNASVGVGRVCYCDADWVLVDIPNSAGLGRPIMVTACAMGANTYGWAALRGKRPWSAQASVAVGTAFGITAAGQVGAVAAGKQVVNAMIAGASTVTIARANTQTQNGSDLIKVSSTDGLFVGLAASGTGIAASTISAIYADQNTVKLSAACTATGSVTATFTFTNFVIVYTNGAFAQGQIT